MEKNGKDSTHMEVVKGASSQEEYGSTNHSEEDNEIQSDTNDRSSINLGRQKNISTTKLKINPRYWHYK